MAGATVTVVDTTSGTKSVAITRADGQYSVSGLRVSGTYSVFAEAPNQPKHTETGVHLTVDETSIVNMTLSSDIVTLDAVNVNEERGTTFGTEKIGTTTTFDTRQIEDIPVIRRDIQEIANLDPRIDLTVNSNGSAEWEMSAMGQNYRYNSVLIDGMQSIDPFGLNANGFNSLRSPVPLEWLQSFSVDFNPVDVTHDGFTGALLSAVTKSGSNQFHGQVYGYYTGTRFRGPNPGQSAVDPAAGTHEQLQERTWGADFSGPIIPNKLFFFFGFEDYYKVQAAPAQNFLPDPTALAAVIAAAEKWGYNPGTDDAGNTISKQKTYLGKIDWNITDSQRLSVIYRRTDSETPNFADFSGTTYTSLSNHWYEVIRKADNYTVLLNSEWTPDFRTDLGAAYVRYNGTNQPNGVPFPEVYVNSVPGTNLSTGAAVANGQLDLGTNYSYQLNALYTNDYNGHLYGEYTLGDHTLKFGADSDKTEYTDVFVQYYYGRYAFANPADFAAGNANYFYYQQAAPGYTIAQSYAHYSLDNFGAVLQDTWRPNQQLTVVGGLRLDYPYIPGTPPALGSLGSTFIQDFGVKNNNTGSGNYTIEPRLGFNYVLPSERKTQVRGGIALLQGVNPAVWVANAYDTFGGTNTVHTGYTSAGAYTTTAPYTGSTITPSPAGSIATFNPNPNYVQTLPPPGPPTPNVDLIDPAFRSPVSWKGNLAFDHTLPFFNTVFTGEVDELWVQKGIYYNSLNINPSGASILDGRQVFNGNRFSSFGTVLDLKNTSKGGSQVYSLSLSRAMRDHWAFALSYSHTHATEVQPLTSSVAGSSFNYRATINPNDNQAHNSLYVVPDAVVLSATREFNFFKARDSSTSLTAVFRAQTGHVYSWVFYGDFNGDGTSGNDAFYVPSQADVSSGKVAFATAAQQTAFYSFVASQPDLQKNLGQTVAPDSSFGSWERTLDLKLTQNIPVVHPLKLTAYITCNNFANLLDKNWGIVDQMDFGTGYNGYNRNVASATYSAAGNGGKGQYTYTFTSSTLASPIVFTDLSRWQVETGLKLEF